MIIDCISDLHGNYPTLEGGDLLIVAGDLTKHDTYQEHILCAQWLFEQNYQEVIIISGNHDCMFQSDTLDLEKDVYYQHVYLCDSGTEFEGLKIWGSPWTPWFEGINPKCAAFMLREEFLKAKFDLIPADTDILITHGPPYGILDSVRKYGPFSHEREVSCGSSSLYEQLEKDRIKPKLHVFGHIHEAYGHIPKMPDMPNTQFVNASYCDEHYRPVNKPIRVIL